MKGTSALAVALRFKIRKSTTPVHWIFGLVCAFFIYTFGLWGGWLPMLVFAVAEAWNDHCDGTSEGFMDWWESFVTFIPGQGVLAILDALTFIVVTWL